MGFFMVKEEIMHSLYHLMDTLTGISKASIGVAPACQEHSTGTEEHRDFVDMW